MKSDRIRRSRRHRIAALSSLLTLMLLLALARPVHAWLLSQFDQAEVLMRSEPLWGMVIFAMLAAISALLAFVSSAVLVPVAVYAWGPAVCFLLLWVGWFAGGLVGYGIGRFLGRPAVERLVGRGTLARYEGWTHSGKSLIPMLLLQLAIPSDLASYLFGLVRCRFATFATALAVAEIPYALGAVYLGASFLERRLLPLAALGVAGLLLSVWALRAVESSHRPSHDQATTQANPLRDFAQL